MIHDDVSKISPSMVIGSIQSTVCPSCGQGKLACTPVCRPCWMHIDPAVQRNIIQIDWANAGVGLAFLMRKLMVTVMHFPDGVQRISPGAYVERDGTLHIDVPEMLAILNFPDNPFNRHQVTEQALEFVHGLYPNIKTKVV